MLSFYQISQGKFWQSIMGGQGTPRKTFLGFCWTELDKVKVGFESVPCPKDYVLYTFANCYILNFNLRQLLLTNMSLRRHQLSRNTLSFRELNYSFAYPLYRLLKHQTSSLPFVYDKTRLVHDPKKILHSLPEVFLLCGSKNAGASERRFLVFSRAI